MRSPSWPSSWTAERSTSALKIVPVAVVGRAARHDRAGRRHALDCSGETTDRRVRCQVESSDRGSACEPSTGRPAPRHDDHRRRARQRRVLRRRARRPALVKKTVNFDQPSAYHLYFGDEPGGSPGSILTWFEFPGAAPGMGWSRPGTIHTLQLGVCATEMALDFWAERLRGTGVASERADGELKLCRSGCGSSWRRCRPGGTGMCPARPTTPRSRRSTPSRASRVRGPTPAVPPAKLTGSLLTSVLGFDAIGEREYRLDGAQRHFRWGYDEAPVQRSRSRVPDRSTTSLGPRVDEDHLGLAGARSPRPACPGHRRARPRLLPVDRLPRSAWRAVRDRDAVAPGFAVDEDPEHLGEELRLPPQHEHLRASLESTLTPLENPRAAGRSA